MKNINPLVSIIVPVYNAEKHIEKCINSLINQTYQNIEILLINDGSKDSSFHVCQRIALTTHKIHLFTQENTGVAYPRNKGISLSHGDYIFFVDSDDFVEPDCIEQFVNKLSESDYDIIIAKHAYLCDGLIKQNNKTYPTVLSSVDCQLFLNHCDITFTTVWNKLYKKEIFNNLKFKENVIIEDEGILHRIYGLNRNIGFINKTTYYYLDNTNRESITRSSTSHKLFNGYYEAFTDRYNYYNNNNCKELLQLVSVRLYGATLDFINNTDIFFNDEYVKVKTVLSMVKKNNFPRYIKLYLKFLMNMRKKKG